MKNSDKILVAIVLGVVILVGVAFVIAFTQPEPTYQDETTPEGATNNYLLAIRQEDYGTAYSYLSPTILGRPATLSKFKQDIQRYQYFFTSRKEITTLEVISSNIQGDHAFIKVRETIFYEGDLFNSRESTRTFMVSLIQNPINDKWRIINSESYWIHCWNNLGGCH